MQTSWRWTIRAMIKAKLNPGGIFVTQSGAAGIKQHHLVWSPVYSTLKTVFPTVHAYNQAVYSFLDEWGFRMVSRWLLRLRRRALEGRFDGRLRQARLLRFI